MDEIYYFRWHIPIKIMFSNGIYFGTGFNHDLTPIGNYDVTKIKEHSFMFNFGWLIEFWKWID